MDEDFPRSGAEARLRAARNRHVAEMLEMIGRLDERGIAIGRKAAT